jgi:hypothetical protein
MTSSLMATSIYIAAKIRVKRGLWPWPVFSMFHHLLSDAAFQLLTVELLNNWFATARSLESSQFWGTVKPFFLIYKFISVPSPFIFPS